MPTRGRSLAPSTRLRGARGSSLLRSTPEGSRARASANGRRPAPGGRRARPSLRADPAHFAREREERPELPKGDCERVSGYGVMGLPFQSGHVLGLRRWTASSIGEAFTSIWHRDPDGRWTFYESAPCEVACTRYFGASVQRTRIAPIGLEWEAPDRLRVRTEDGAVDWTVKMGSTPVTRVMGAV